MFYDEKARKKLLSTYEALSSLERKAYRLLGAIYAPVAVTRYAKLLNEAVPVGGKRTYWSIAGNVREMLDRWRVSKLVKKSQSGGTAYWHCAPLLAEPALRESIALGEFAGFETAIECHGGFQPEETWNGRRYFKSFAAAYRTIRTAYYTGSVALYDSVDAEGVSVGWNDAIDAPLYGDDRRGLHIPLSVLFLCNPIDRDRFLALPPAIGTVAIAAAATFLSGDAEDGPALRELLRRYHEMHPDDPYLSMEVARRAIVEGAPEKARRAIRNVAVENEPQGAEIQAVLSLLSGDPDAALGYYEEGLKVLRKRTGRRKAVFPTWCGLFYPMLLYRTEMVSGGEGDPLKPSRHMKKFREYVEPERASGGLSERPNAFRMIALLGEGEERRRHLFEPRMTDFLRGSGDFADPLCFALVGSWIDPAALAAFAPVLVECCEEMLAHAFRFFAAEIASVLRDVAPDETARLSALPEPAHPLKKLISYKPDWERSLEALLALAPSPDGSAPAREDAGREKRVIWEVKWFEDKGRGLRDVVVVPIEQTKQAKGWSKGKKISIKRLAQEPEGVESLAEADRAALAGIARNAYYYGPEYFFEPHRTLSALVGHPNVVDERGGKVEVAWGEPRLLLETAKDGPTLRMEPFPDEREMKKGSLLVLEEGLIRVVRLSESHIRIAGIVGPQGIRVPDGESARLFHAAAALGSFVAVHADEGGIETNVETIAADATLCVLVVPDGDGVDVETVVRPLGEGSAPCSPGAGGAVIFGEAGGRRVQARRDLAAERAALDKFLDACRALRYAEEAGEFRWRVPEADRALELLLQIGALGEDFIVEWPKGGEKDVTTLGADAIQMSVAARDGRDWFELSAAFVVDEGCVLTLKNILALLDESKGRFVRVSPDRFAALSEGFVRRLEELRAIGSLRGDALRVSALAAPMLDDLSGEVGAFEGGEALRERLLRIDEAARMDPLPPSTFKGELRPYQEEGFRWLARLAHWGGGACLADDMGLGKTVQALALLLSRAALGPSLVVAPTSVCTNWVDEATRFAPTLVMKELRAGDRGETVRGLAPMDVLVVSYGLMQSEADLLSGVRWSSVVLDEAQNIKNMATKRSAAAMGLDADFRLITTGTPIENNLGELWNLFRFLNPGYLGSLENFNKRFATPIERDGSLSAKNRLRKIVAPFVLRRTKGQVLTELPPKTEVALRVDLKPGERELYEALRRTAVEDLAASDGEDARFKVFAHLMKLRRACCNASLVLPDGDEPRPSAKLEAFAELVAELLSGGHKALVFSQFVSHLDLLRKKLEEMGVSYQYLDGATPQAERSRRVAAFQRGEGEVFLISLKAGGTGLNLTAADYVVHMDPWWNPAVEEQASDRTHRIGQRRPVTVYRIVAKNTIEEKIVDLHAWKRDLAESLLDESETPTRLSSDEMLRLIRNG